MTRGEIVSVCAVIQALCAFRPSKLSLIICRFLGDIWNAGGQRYLQSRSLGLQASVSIHGNDEIALPGPANNQKASIRGHVVRISSQGFV